VNKNTFWVLLPFFIVLFNLKVSAQLTDTTLKQNYDVQIGSVYLDPFESNYPLYNGSQIFPYAIRITNGFRNFLTPGLLPATLTYDGKTFKNIMSYYDLLEGNLIIRHFDKSNFVRLHADRVDRFTISEHTFIRLKPDSTNTNISAGFYDLLHDGKLKFLAKRWKTLEEKATGTALERIIIEHTKYYLQQGQVYYEIDGKSDLLKVLKPHNKLVAKFIKSQKLNFTKKSKEASILSTVRYYDQAVK
jgi:hypothetical protein